MEKYDRSGQATDDDIMRRMRVECWIAKATNAHSEYVIPLGFLRQQWLRQRTSELRYTYIVCLVRVQNTRHCVQNLRISQL